MGTPVGEATGRAPILLECDDCGPFETDETMGNDCPECGAPSANVRDASDPRVWRKRHRSGELDD